MRRLASLLFWGGAATVLLPTLAAALAVSALARPVVPVSPHAPEIVEVQRAMWIEGEPVAALYGVPLGKTWILRPDPAKIVVPEEDPTLVLLRLDKQKNENPLRAETVWFLAGVAAHAGAACFALGLALALGGRP